MQIGHQRAVAGGRCLGVQRRLGGRLVQRCELLRDRAAVVEHRAQLQRVRRPAAVGLEQGQPPEPAAVGAQLAGPPRSRGRRWCRPVANGSSAGCSARNRSSRGMPWAAAGRAAPSATISSARMPAARGEARARDEHRGAAAHRELARERVVQPDVQCRLGAIRAAGTRPRRRRGVRARRQQHDQRGGAGGLEHGQGGGHAGQVVADAGQHHHVGHGGQRQHGHELRAAQGQQVLHAQVRAGQQRHRAPQPRQRVGGPGQVLAEHGAQQGLALQRVDGDHRQPDGHDQRQRAGPARAARRRRPASAARASGSRYMPRPDRDPDDPLRGHGRDRVRAGGVAGGLVLDHDHVHLLEQEQQRQADHGQPRAGQQVAQPRAVPALARGEARWPGPAHSPGPRPPAPRPCPGTRRSRRAPRPPGQARTPAAASASPTRLEPTSR